MILKAVLNPGHVVCRRTTDLDSLAETLERASVAQTVGLLSLYQTLPPSVSRALAFPARCSNITRLNLVSVPMPDLPTGVRFDSVRELDVYCTHPAGATPATLRLLARMPRLRRLGLRGLLPGDDDDDDSCPALPCALESFLWTGGVSAGACARILAQAVGPLQALELYVFTGSAALARILSAVPAPVTLRAVTLSVGTHARHTERAPYADVVAGFLRRCACLREITLQLLPGLALAGLLSGLPAQSRLRSLWLRDPEPTDAAWLARALTGDNPALAALRAVQLEHDFGDEYEDNGVCEACAEAAALLRPACAARRIRLWTL